MLIFGNAVAIDGGEIELSVQVDGGELSLDNFIDGGEQGIFMPMPGGGEPYTGELIVTPKAHEEQRLATANKVMPGDVVVLEVPYYETHNENGLTAYIASEV